jgi:hypothetical protein
MKAIIIIAVCIGIFTNCRDHSKVSNFSGTYVTHFKNEFSVTDDTLIVSNSSSSDITYHIERRSGFHKIRNGVLKNKNYKLAKWIATYDANSNVLKETDLGRQITVFPENNSIKLGSSDYKKVK